MSNETLSLPNPILIESIQPDVPIAGITGTVTVPSYTFLGDTDTGIYSSTLNTLNFAAGGVPSLSVSPTAVTTTVPNLTALGSNTSPAYSFSGDTDTGMYNSAADTINFTTGGVSRMAISTTAVSTTVPNLAAPGSVLSPAYSFSIDPNTGIYSSATDTVSIATNGVDRMSVSTTAVSTSVPNLTAAGLVSAPAYSFASDTDTGMYSSAADTLNFTTGGVDRMTVSSTAITTTVPNRAALGSASAPAYSFSSDTNTGIYSSSADTLNFATGGVSRLSLSNANLTTNVPIVATGGTYSTPTYGFSANLGFRAPDANTIEMISDNAGNGTDAYLMRLSAAGGWSQVRNNGSLTKPSTFIDQQYYGGDLTSGYSMVTLGDAWTSIATAWNYIKCWNTGGGASFRVQGNGAVYADNAYSSSGADYAEYFESTDGTAIPTGSTVVLVDGKVRRAIETDPLTSIIGVVRPKNSPDVAAVGNVYEDYWSGKYEKDEFGAPVMEEFTGYSWAVDGKMVSYHSDRVPVDVVVPEDKQVVVSQRQKWAAGYDPEAVYVARSQRTEWHVIGLLGQIPVRTGEFVNSNWILLGNIADGTVAKKYLVR